MAVTLAQLRTQARQRADMANSTFVDDDELTTYINDSYLELYDLLVSKFEDYFVGTPTSFTLASGVSTYTLPSDFYKLVGLDKALGGGDYYALRPFNFNERNIRSTLSLYRGIYPNIRYRVVGGVIRFTPEDQAAGDYRIWYVPNATLLTATTDTIAAECDRWKLYIIVDAAIKMLLKEESDVQAHLLQKQALIRRIDEMAANRDVGEPMRIQDVYSVGYEDPLLYRY